MDINNRKSSAELLIEICKQINMRKHIKRTIIDTRTKVMSLPKFRLTKIKATSLLAPEELLVTNEIKELRKTLRMIAKRILNKNTLTAEDINPGEFELGSTNLLDGHCELLSPNGEKTFIFIIETAEILAYTTELEISKADPIIYQTKRVIDLQDYIQFMNLPPF